MEHTPYAKATLDTRVVSYTSDLPEGNMPDVTMAVERIVDTCLRSGLEVNDDTDSHDQAEGFVDLMLGSSFDGKHHHEMPRISADRIMRRINEVAAGAHVTVHFRLGVHVSYVPRRGR